MVKIPDFSLTRAKTWGIFFSEPWSWSLRHELLGAFHVAETSSFFKQTILHSEKYGETN